MKCQILWGRLWLKCDVTWRKRPRINGDFKSQIKLVIKMQSAGSKEKKRGAEYYVRHSRHKTLKRIGYCAIYSPVSMFKIIQDNPSPLCLIIPPSRMVTNRFKRTTYGCPIWISGPASDQLPCKCSYHGLHPRPLLYPTSIIVVQTMASAPNTELHQPNH
jgi:hypothetical protein